ncbi:MAG: T9SS type A sorting domain-containing protein [bacterium]|nr:T9SS type A sorting domain-containing protein [bacterium]
MFRLYSGHLKASQGTEEEQRRLAECQVLRGELEELDPGSLFMFAGDFNLYTSFEPAYQFLLGLEPSPNSRLLDPINRPGAWNNSISFADVHTQSPRTQSFGGGATGGIDDRFDFILASAAWMDTAGSYVLPATYTSFGNDGDHFNQAVNDGTNQAVPDSVADALHAMADHLPVFVDVVLRPTSTPVTPLPPVVETPLLATCYPNPFNPILNVSLAPSVHAGELRVFDVMGRSLRSVSLAPTASASALTLDFSHYSSGPYFIVVNRGVQNAVSRVILQK